MSQLEPLCQKIELKSFNIPDTCALGKHIFNSKKKHFLELLA